MTEYNFKEFMSRPDRLTPGHRMCAGCGATIALRNVMKAIKPEDHAVICNATSCMEVSTFTYPYSSWKDSYIHNAFENAAATCGGVEAAYNALKKRGKLDDSFKFIAVGGDGGTYDIGFQSLSGAMERNHDMVYVCYDNEAYMNTGIQRSSATPMFADTTTTPAGKVSDGKPQNRKDITEVIAAHRVPYVAQTTFLGNFSDLQCDRTNLCDLLFFRKLIQRFGQMHHNAHFMHQASAFFFLNRIFSSRCAAYLATGRILSSQRTMLEASGRSLERWIASN